MAPASSIRALTSPAPGIPLRVRALQHPLPDIGTLSHEDPEAVTYGWLSKPQPMRFAAGELDHRFFFFLIVQTGGKIKEDLISILTGNSQRSSKVI